MGGASLGYLLWRQAHGEYMGANMILYISAIVCPIFSLGLLWLFVPAARKQRSVLARALVLTIGLSLAIAIVVGKTPPSMVHWFIIPRYPLVTVGAFGVWLLCSLNAAILAAAFVMARRNPANWRIIVGRWALVLGTVKLVWMVFVRVQ